MMRGKKRLPKKEWRIKTKALSFLPEELLFAEILTRLPVKSLMRLKCVSKSWLTRISRDSSFVDAHFLNYRPSSNDNPLVIVIGHEKVKKKTCLQKAWVLSDQVPNTRKLDASNVLAANECVRIIGSCNGLVCLTNRHSIMLWNPATRQVRKLSSAPIEPKSKQFGFGFGFDTAKRDFKVVKLTLKGSEDAPVLCTQVLDRRSGVLRNCYDEKRGVPIESVFGVLDYAVAVNGALYWVAYWGDRSRVLSFDLRDETLRESDGPDIHTHGLKLWNGLLAAYTADNEYYMIVMWAATTSDSGLRWNKVMMFKTFQYSDLWMDQFIAVEVKKCGNCGDQLFLEDFSISPNRRRRVLLDELNPIVDGVCNYVESVVSVF